MVKPGYKHTEIGVLPEDWDVVSLLDEADLLNGLTYTPSNVRDYGLLVMRSSNVQNGRFAFDDNVYVNCDVEDSKLIKKGDILICVRNGSAALIGKCAKADRDYNATFGAFMAVLRGANNDYLHQLLQQGAIQRHIAKNSDSTINQITNGDFKQIAVPFPKSQAERTTISDVLSDIDTLIVNLEKLIAKKKAIKQGAMQELLTGKRRLPGFDGEWIRVPFQKIYKFAKEGGTPSTNNADFYINGNIPFAKIEDLECKYIDSTSSYITEAGVENSSAWLIPIHSVILSNGATIGAVSINRIPITTKQGILGIVPSEIAEAEYLYYYFSSTRFLSEMKKITTHGTMDCAYLKDINTIELFIPSDMKEQRAIVNVLSDMDSEIEKLGEELYKFLGIKQGMMSELLTGRIRLV